MKRLRWITATAAAAAMAGSVALAAPEGTSAWWDDAVFYEIMVRSFRDSDSGPLANDGNGDIQGLIDKLDYLNDGNPATTDDLGVTALWLLPMGEASSEAGYSVDDYEAIEHDYGTNADFRRLMDEAHKRGIRVIVDLVLNHTSNKHAWYVAGMNPESHYHQFYIWRDEPPMGKDGKPAHNWSKQPNGKWLYAAFSPGIPDLNLENPIVKERMFRIARFWLEDMGVDGFRLDAIKYLVEQGDQTVSTPATIEWMREFRDYCKAIKPDCYIVGEVWSGSDEVSRYGRDQIDMCFEFELSGAFIQMAGTGRAGFLPSKLERAEELFGTRRYATFLSNHDMMRVMEQLDRDPLKMSVAAAALLTAPGVPFLYYGEEVGIVGHDREGRSPMQWSTDVNAGFSPTKPFRPVEEEPERFNVAVQTDDPHSLLSNYRQLVALRSREKTLRHGSFTPLGVTPPSLVNYVQPESEDPARYGYELHEDGSVTFVFDPTQNVATKEDVASVTSVSVAGDFNRWTPGTWTLAKNDDGRFTGKRAAGDFTLENHEFKFVVGKDRWIEPPAEQANRKHSGMAGESYNIVLHRKDGIGTEAVTLADDTVTYTFDPARCDELVERTTGAGAHLRDVPVESVSLVRASDEWQDKGLALAKGDGGVFTLTLPRDEAPAGEFRLLVNGTHWVRPSGLALNTRPTRDGSPLFAFLRGLPNEATLVIINPAEEPVTNYTVLGGKLEGFPEGRLHAVNAITGEEMPAPERDAHGALKPYAPVPTLDRHSWTIIRLTPASGEIARK